MSTQEWTTTGISVAPGDTLALELVRVTEAAAIAAGRWVGRGERDNGRIAGTAAMREHLASVRMRGVVVIGDAGMEAGFGEGPVCDVCITVGDGALSAARDVPNSLSAIAVAERGAFYEPSPGAVMDKLAVGSDCADVVDITRPVADNLWAIAAAKGVRVPDLVVAVPNRPRHAALVRELRDAGARIHLLEGGDIAGAIAAARDDGPVDVLLGSGGAAGGVVAAAALSCIGGALQMRLRTDDVDKVLHTGDLVRGENILFCATGVTGSESLHGVRHHSGRTTTQSIVLCSNPRTARTIASERRLFPPD
ncbi:fructose-bisphosphatase class II family protein [Amycolatopsis acidicola]|uniref:Fructose-1,6-bisphosphatase n=1 Tax=Amycolatopsis acidicola TaxID=2596893 RepID=A0A5N0VL40_9PSEU|nr:fructose-bisphosphatase class II [Amycolatopsis acidicola]KAA9166054.1 fructose-bisphosphatase class II family protein [Amycolatopsis acidicola]